MKQTILRILITSIVLTQFMLGENIENNQKPKPLRVEEGAIKIGGNNQKIKVNAEKTRSILVKNPSNTTNENINMNIGKVEFYVK